jgi:uncharacterized protein YndB with AHSA1/START domain
MTDTADSGTYEVSISRYFDAAPALVYQAFTDPEHLAQWFGPLMFSVPLDTVSVDLRPGGHWRMTMVGKDDPSWLAPVNATFSEVVQNQLLVGYETADGVPGIEDGTKLMLSIEFIPEGDGTRLELRQGPLPAETREMAAVGWAQSFHKLDALLATPAKFRPGNQGDAS